jgi:NAD(P)-dependent dehydrogenase (short-subunit alcohol dehydrogenase family)
MSARKILVTGATGATGKETVRLLQERGQAVRALVRREDDRADTLRKSGAEVVLGDLRDFESVRAALEGIRSAYFGINARMYLRLRSWQGNMGKSLETSSGSTSPRSPSTTKTGSLPAPTVWWKPSADCRL